MLLTWDIWSLLRLNTGTHILDPNEFYWSTHPSTDYKWCETLVGRLLKYQTILIGPKAHHSSFDDD